MDTIGEQAMHVVPGCKCGDAGTCISNAPAVHCHATMMKAQEGHISLTKYARYGDVEGRLAEKVGAVLVNRQKL